MNLPLLPQNHKKVMVEEQPKKLIMLERGVQNNLDNLGEVRKDIVFGDKMSNLCDAALT